MIVFHQAERGQTCDQGSRNPQESKNVENVPGTEAFSVISEPSTLQFICSSICSNPCRWHIEVAAQYKYKYLGT
jgi:hypothetical protein